MNSSTNRKLKVAIINGAFALAGALAVGLFSNWDKIFGPPTVEAPYTGYKPTGEFDIEARYFMDVSGTRRDFEILAEKNMNTVEIFVEQIKKDIKSSSQEDTDQEIDVLDRLVGIAHEEKTTPDEIISTILSVYAQYYTVEEIQELNKFFSTDLMRAMVSKSSVVWNDLLPALHDLNKTRIRRFSARIRTEFPEHQDIQTAADLLDSIANQK